jgi:hypothetical protein
MDNSFRHSKPFRSQSTTRPFATAIRALAAGCVLIGIAALLHDRSPMARLLAERGAPVDHKGRMGPANALPISNARAIAGDTLSAPASSAARGTVSDSTAESSDLGERPRGNAQHFWNASQSTAKGGPAIRLGTPMADENSFDRGKSRSSIGDEPGDRSPLVTRTYRPVSMSAASLERLVRPLLTARGQTIAANGCSSVPNSVASPAERSAAVSDANSAEPSGALIVTDRPEAIGRIDALCSDLESASPRIAIDLAVANVVPAAGSLLPSDQWRNSFGIVDGDLSSVLKQIGALGRTKLSESRQLQAINGAWIELEWSATSVNSPVSLPRAADLGETETERPATSPALSPTSPTALTTLRLRPTVQSDGAIRVEVRAQSSRVEARSHNDRPQLVTVRFNTQVVLREGATGVIHLFVDKPFDARTASRAPNNSAGAALVIPGGPTIPAAQILPQPGASEQTLLLLMPRIAIAAPAVGRIAHSNSRDPG